jgi:hypothetical protein
MHGLARVVTLIGALVAAEFHNGNVIKDSSGERVRAHQPHIFKQGSTYYWYGSAQVAQSDGTKGDVNLYTSTDLYTWKSHGRIYTSPGQSPFVARVSMLGQNPNTKKYVLWAKGGGANFQVATASTLMGPFTHEASMSVANGHGDDMQSFRDHANAFLVYTDRDTGYQIHTQMLSDTWTAFKTGEAPVTLLNTKSLEAPAPFYSSVSKQFYVWCSHTSGWDPNAALLMTSSQGMRSSFKSLGNPTHDKKTFGTQGSHILHHGTSGGTDRFVYMGDRYEEFHAGVEGSRYIFLPMEVRSNGDVLILNKERWSIEEWPDFSDEQAMLVASNRTMVEAITV